MAIAMTTFSVGDKVQGGVFVAGQWVKTRTGIVVAVHSGYCDVDVGSLHGCAPWVLKEPNNCLRLMPDESANSGV